MSRRSRLSKALREQTKGSRHRVLDVGEWLKRPNASCTREEAYALLRQFYYEVERNRWKRNPLVRIVWALVLIVSFPLRLLWRWIRSRQPKGKEE